MITKAIRDANLNGVEIKNGNYIGFTDKTMYASEPTAAETFEKLCDRLGIAEKNFLIVMYGATALEEDKEKVRAYAESLKNIEFYEIEGGQEVYDFILIIE